MVAKEEGGSGGFAIGYLYLFCESPDAISYPLPPSFEEGDPSHPVSSFPPK